MLRSIALLIFLTGCGDKYCGVSQYTSSQFATIHGVLVLPKGNEVSPLEVETAIDVTWDVMSDVLPEYFTPEVKTWFFQEHQLTIEFGAGPVPCWNYEEGRQGECFGITDGSRVWISNDDSIGETSLAHELIHVFGIHVMGQADHYHQNPAWFEKSGGDNSAEQHAEDRLNSEFTCN